MAGVAVLRKLAPLLTLAVDTLMEAVIEQMHDTLFLEAVAPPQGCLIRVVSFGNPLLYWTKFIHSPLPI